MKIEAQNNNQPTIRNIAKLLMNSINGRFGMHTDLTKQAFLEQTQIEQISRDYSVLSEINFGALSLVAFTLEDACSFGHDNLSERLKIFVEGLPGNTNVAIAAARDESTLNFLLM